MIIFSLAFTFSLASVPGGGDRPWQSKRDRTRGSAARQVYTGIHGLGLRQF